MSHHDPGARRAGGAGGPLSSQADRQETLTSQDAVPRSSRLGSRPDAGQGLTQAGLDALASTLKQAVDRLLPFASENRTAGGGLPSLASVINPRDFGAASAPSLPTGFGSTVDPTADPGTQGSGFARLDLGEVLTSETPPAEAHLDASPSWPASPGAGFTPAFDRTAGTNAELPSSTPRGGVVDLMGLGDGSSQSPNPVMPFAAPAGGGFNVAISAPAPTPTGLAPTEAMGRAVVAAAATGRASESRVERVPIRAQGFANVVDETANLGPGTGPSALPFAVDPGD